ncbi:hypothetical protein GCM10023190_04290 [Enteractinococcus fodinae]|uniref:CPBP family intramembrane metalloprotease n=1 Tax=Enteractinococcus fodinae TaxID=684663 RepID=A0ABU2B0F7_9MICC|nr:CPBP family intramembrane glutamate endopeptidase [Enteractinococcus fodinae]MDR7347093.1 hypothetical protein [Enteractinococcus fodinae]
MVGTISAAGSIIADYSMVVLPGLVLILGCFWLARTDTDPLLRIVILVLGFILVRDAMTPAGLWDFGVVNGVVPWIRMTENPVVLLALGSGSLILVAATLSDTRLRALVWWGKPNISTLLFGIGGALLVVAPIFALTVSQPIEARGGTVVVSVLPALAFMTLAGNLVFAACHVYIAITVTSVGWPLLAFTLWEGLICAVLRLRRGVFPAAVAHGLAIFLLASGLV